MNFLLVMVDLVRFIIGTHLTIIQSQLTNKIINMKKFTLLLASAAVASSAVAAEPALARRSNILNASVSEKQCNVTYQDASVALKSTIAMLRLQCAELLAMVCCLPNISLRSRMCCTQV